MWASLEVEFGLRQLTEEGAYARSWGEAPSLIFQTFCIKGCQGAEVMLNIQPSMLIYLTLNLELGLIEI